MDAQLARIFGGIICFFIFHESILAQENGSFDTAFVNNQSYGFFERNASVEKLEYSLSSSGRRTVCVTSKLSWADTGYMKSFRRASDCFNFRFAGDVYRFEKKYGTFSCKEAETDIIARHPEFMYPSLNFTIQKDSIFCVVSYTDTTKKTDNEDILFIKVEERLSETILKKLSVRIANELMLNCGHCRIDSKDSIAIFRLLIAKDSCIKRIELNEGTYSIFSKTVFESLKSNCGIKPMEQGGRKVDAYVELFFRLNDDKSITVSSSF